MGDPQSNQLWVSLSALGDGNIFAVLPELMKKMMETDGSMQNDDEELDLILPSDDTWQTKIYYKLVEKQRIADSLLEDQTEEEEGMQTQIEEPTEPTLHEWTIRPKKKTLICDQTPKPIEMPSRSSGPGPITWTVGDIAKAGCLLTSPPIQTVFEDEQEMRRVYTLIYDAFRYKNVLTQALNDVAFFVHYPKLSEAIPHVWLLLYDLYHRSFKKRETSVAPLAVRLFTQVNLIDVENALWKMRVKLAASIARLRIEHNALSLSDLLPNHLRDERITGQAANSPVTCWINTKKTNSSDIQKEIETLFKVTLVETADLGPENYKWDKHCPQIISFHASMRTDLARSHLVKGYKLIVQDKSFCLGPATFGKLISELELAGSVIQTHVNSPRTTAYLANLLSHNEKINKLMAFSAGNRKGEYESYFSQLGMTNVKIFADKLIDVSPDSHYMEEVVAVFATPPNSYSAVNDPIDLVCSRGGDLSMLEVLTESEETKEGKERVGGILEEQRKTLRFAMSRPQIQFVLYETHSELDIENGHMVQRTLKEVNKIAKIHHAALQGRFFAPNLSEETMEINNNDSAIVLQEDLVTEAQPSEPKPVLNTDKLFANLSVPDTDIFDLPNLPSLCLSDTSCMNLTKEGCFLALLQRKQVIRLDHKYMIQMAENRGLFGRTSSSTTRTKGSKGSRKKQQKPPTPPLKTKRRIKDAEVARIAAPTHTFLRHTRDPHEIADCSRCRAEEEERSKVSLGRQWWSETTRYLTELRSTLVRNKIIAPNKNKAVNVKAMVDCWAHKTARIDEIAASSREANAPIIARLRLTRGVRMEKVPMELPITSVELFTNL